MIAVGRDAPADEEETAERARRPEEGAESGDAVADSISVSTVEPSDAAPAVSPMLDYDAPSTPPEPIHAASGGEAGDAAASGGEEASVADPAVASADTAAPAASVGVDAGGASPRAARAPRRRKTATAATTAPPAVEAPGSLETAPAAVRSAVVTPSAVDSALSQRVETLEHGLRRVLDEVRKLRQLLADPSEDR